MTEPLKHVVVLEDEASYREIVSSFLTASYRVSCFESIDATLDFLKENQVDVIISDYYLNNDENGLDFLSLIREKYPKVIRIIISGKRDKKLSLEAVNRAEVHGILDKPFKQEQILSLLEKSLGKLEKSEKIFEELIGHFPDSVMVFNTMGKLIYFNEKAESSFYFSRKPNHNYFIYEIFKSSEFQSNEAWLSALKIGLNQFLSFQGEDQHYGFACNGEYFPVELSISTYEDIHNDVLSLVNVRDISTKIKSEKELHVAQEKLGKAYQVAKLGYWELNLENLFFSISENTYSWFDSDEMKRALVDFTSFRNLICEEDRPYVLETFQNHLNKLSKYNIEYRIQKPDSSFMHILETCYTEVDDQGNPLKSFGVLQNITEIRNLKEEVSVTKYHNEQLSELAPVSIVTIDEHLDVKNSNPAFHELIGVDDLKNTNLKDFISEKYCGAIVECFQNKGELDHDEIEIHSKQGESIWCSLSSKKIFKNQKEIEYLIVLEDIREQKKKQKEKDDLNELLEQKVLERTKELNESIQDTIQAKNEAEFASQAKTKFLANMSHEIRTPLNAISGFCQLIESLEDELPTNLNEYLAHIQDASLMLNEVIGNVLDLSKIEEEKYEVNVSDLDLGSLIKGVFHVSQSRATIKGVHLRYKLSETLPQWIQSDRGMLNQILMNLVSNAIKFTPKEKSVTIEADVDGDVINLSVRDEGIGLSEEQAERVFEAFEQADASTKSEYGGTGLGLPISKKLAGLLGGSLTVKSKLGSGSTFVLKIPYIEVNAKSEGPQDKAQLKLKSDVKILIVEDNIVNQKVLKGVLNTFNVESDVCENGKEALNLLKAKNYDLVFVDLHMPVMDGHQFLTEYQNVHEAERKPIYILTADVFTSVRKSCLEKGATGFLTKPIELRKIKEVLLDHFDTSKN